jgi:hypothetical protein
MGDDTSSGVSHLLHEANERTSISLEEKILKIGAEAFWTCAREWPIKQLSWRWIQAK